MNYWSQLDPQWKDDNIGLSNYKIGGYGCFLVSLAMLDGRNPKVCNAILTANECYSGANLLSKCAGQALGLQYDGKTTQRPNFTCIFETNFYQNKGYDQHFAVLLDTGEIIDPLIYPAQITTNHYENNIISYRLFKEKQQEETMGIDQKQVSSLFEDFDRRARAKLLGSTDEQGVKDDIAYRVPLIMGQGNTTAFGDQLEAFLNAPDFQWVLKTEAEQKLIDMKLQVDEEKEKLDKLEKATVKQVNGLEEQLKIAKNDKQIADDNATKCSTSLGHCLSELKDKPKIVEVEKEHTPKELLGMFFRKLFGGK